MNKSITLLEKTIYRGLTFMDWINEGIRGGKPRAKGRFSENYLLEIYYRMVHEEIHERLLAKDIGGRKARQLRQQAEENYNER